MTVYTIIPPPRGSILLSMRAADPIYGELKLAETDIARLQILCAVIASIPIGIAIGMMLHAFWM